MDVDHDGVVRAVADFDQVINGVDIDILTAQPQLVNFGGGLTVQTGWAWRNAGGHLLRMGLHYYNGESNQFSFFDKHEQQIGFGVWYDN